MWGVVVCFPCMICISLIPSGSTKGIGVGEVAKHVTTRRPLSGLNPDQSLILPRFDPIKRPALDSRCHQFEPRQGSGEARLANRDKVM